MTGSILDILEKSDKKLTNEQIAQMIGSTEEEVARIIRGLEKENIIVGYKTMINWEKTDKELVTSIIGFLPASNPQLEIYVVIDSPSKGALWGSTVAAPVFREVALQTARIMNITPDKHTPKKQKK